MSKQRGRRAASAALKQSLIVLGTAVVSAVPAQAFEITTGKDDLEIRWDNTIRYSLARRMGSQDDRITGSLNNNDGDRHFGKGDIVSNRLDLLSEFDLVYRKHHGFRVSGAAWGDDAYNHLDASSAAGSNHLENGVPATGLGGTTQRFQRGISGELLDAFVFTKFDIGDSPLYLKAGKHTLYWGESLFLGGVANGIAYAQSPLDVAKGLAIPGAEAKELFRPLNNISASFQATNDLSLAAQYFLDWKPFRFPEAGSYLGFFDFILDGGESLYTPLGLLTRRDDIEPEKRGDFGLAARWSPEWLDGTLGFYYRNFSDRVPTVVLDARGFGPFGTSGQPVGYRLSYGDDIDLFGISLAKQVGGISVGAELSYRRNMPLLSDPVLVASPMTVALAQAGIPALAPFANAQTALPERGDTGGARGNTLHGVLNLLGQAAKTPLFDSLDWKAELTWSHWQKVTRHEELFKGRSGYSGIDRVTRNAWGVALTVEPRWYQVFPGVDLLLPLAISSGVSGHSAVALGGVKDSGAYGVGIAADVRNQYRFDLKYVDFFGKLDASDPRAVVANDTQAYLKDRGMLVFTFKTTF